MCNRPWSTITTLLDGESGFSCGVETGMTEHMHRLQRLDGGSLVSLTPWFLVQTHNSTSWRASSFHPCFFKQMIRFDNATMLHSRLQDPSVKQVARGRPRGLTNCLMIETRGTKVCFPTISKKLDCQERRDSTHESSPPKRIRFLVCC